MKKSLEHSDHSSIKSLTSIYWDFTKCPVLFRFHKNISIIVDGGIYIKRDGMVQTFSWSLSKWILMFIHLVFVLLSQTTSRHLKCKHSLMILLKLQSPIWHFAQNKAIIETELGFSRTLTSLRSLWSKGQNGDSLGLKINVSL